MISRQKIHRLVESVYNYIFKVFNVVESTDKPNNLVGVFVSLGITTQLETIRSIKDIFDNMKEYSAKVVEIVSEKVGNTYVNTVHEDVNPGQYRLKELPEDLMNREEAVSELERMQEKINPQNDLDSLVKCGVKVQKLKDLIGKLDESNKWDSHLIQRLGDCDYRIFHLDLNYERRGDLEYRVGILISEKEKRED